MLAPSTPDDQYSHRLPDPLRERVAERVPRLARHVGDGVDGAAHLLAVVLAGFGEVVGDRALVIRGAAPRVLAAQNAVVFTPLDPALELGGAQGVEGVGHPECVENLGDGIGGIATFLVLPWPVP